MDPVAIVIGIAAGVLSAVEKGLVAKENAAALERELVAKMLATPSRAEVERFGELKAELERLATPRVGGK